jgi:hypothetical protein
MSLLSFIENIMIFILRKDKNATKRYIENHPELKGKRKEINERLDAHKKKWAKSDAMDVIMGKKKKMDHPIE